MTTQYKHSALHEQIGSLQLAAGLIDIPAAARQLDLARQFSHPDDVRFHLFHAKQAALDSPLGELLAACIDDLMREATRQANDRQLAINREWLGAN